MGGGAVRCHRCGDIRCYRAGITILGKPLNLQPFGAVEAATLPISPGRNRMQRAQPSVVRNPVEACALLAGSAKGAQFHRKLSEHLDTVMRA